MSHVLAVLNLGQRHRRSELMDQPGLEEREHARALSGLARINRLSRSASIFWPSLERLAERQHPHPLRVLDVACGGGDVLVTLAKRAQRNRLTLQLSGCDMSVTALEMARRQAAESGLTLEFFEHDVLKTALSARFDVVMCSLFLHHLDEPEAIAVLRSMSQAAARAVLINDLIRSRRGYALAVIGTQMFSRSHIVHVDGPLSVAGAFTPSEAFRLCEQAGLSGATMTRHWPQRFLIEWRRP